MSKPGDLRVLTIVVERMAHHLEAYLEQSHWPTDVIDGVNELKNRALDFAQLAARRPQCGKEGSRLSHAIARRGRP